MFCDRMDVEKSQRAPFQFFRHCETFFRITFFFHQKAPLQFFDVLQQWMKNIAKGSPIRSPKFSGTVEENTLKSFCYFREYFDTLMFFLLFLSLRYGAALGRSGLFKQLCGYFKFFMKKSILISLQKNVVTMVGKKQILQDSSRHSCTRSCK